MPDQHPTPPTDRWPNALPKTVEEVREAEAWLAENPIELPESLKNPPFHLLPKQEASDATPWTGPGVGMPAAGFGSKLGQNRRCPPMNDALPPATATRRDGPDVPAELFAIWHEGHGWNGINRLWINATPDGGMAEATWDVMHGGGKPVLIGVHPSHRERADVAERERDEFKAIVERILSTVAELRRGLPEESDAPIQVIPGPDIPEEIPECYGFFRSNRCEWQTKDRAWSDAVVEECRRSGIEDVCTRLIGVSPARLAAAESALSAARAAVQEHHDQKGDDRCHLDDLKLYHAVLGEGVDPYVGALPPDEDMKGSCDRYIRQRRCPGVVAKLPGDMTIAQLTAALATVTAERDAARSDRNAMLGIAFLPPVYTRSGEVWVSGRWEIGRRQADASTMEEAMISIRKAAGLSPTPGDVRDEE